MARRYYSSVAVPTTLSSAITDSGTTLSLAASTGFPSSYPFTLILDEDTAYEEVVTVTASLGGKQFTITRGSDGTTAQAHSGGASARHGFSKRDLDEPNEHISLSAGVHGVTGNVVGSSDAQVLTNKTLTSPTITTPTLTLKQSTSPTPTAEGDIQWDSDDNTIKVGDGATTKTFSDDSVNTAAIATHAALTATHGVSGAIVGTSDAQVLTNKTVTTPTLTLKQSATPTPTAEGDIQWDTDDNRLAIGDGAATKIISPDNVAAILTNKTIDGDDNTLQDIPASAIKNAAWTTFTPTFTSGTGTAIGNGTLTGRYQRVGRTIHFKIWFQPGTTTTFGTSSIIFTGLPFNLDDSGNEREIFQGYYMAGTTATWYDLIGLTNSATSIALMYKKTNIDDEVTMLALTSSAPQTFTYPIYIAIGGTFQATS